MRIKPLKNIRYWIETNHTHDTMLCAIIWNNNGKYMISKFRRVKRIRKSYHNLSKTLDR